MDKMISDEFLYAYMPQAEKIILNSIPLENQISHEFSKSFNKKMKALLKYQRKTPVMKRIDHHMKVAAAIFLITLTLAFGTVMSVDAYRIRFFELVTQVWEEFTSIVTYSDAHTDRDALVFVSPSYIPEGYTILEETNSPYENTIIYADEEGTEIYYAQTLLTQGEVILDTENTVIQTMLIGSQEVMLIENKGIAQVYWHDNFNSFSLMGKIGKSELIRMAESIN